MSFVQSEHPFYRPLYVRVGIVITTVIWSIIEMYSGSPLWLTIAVGVCLFSIWTFLIDYKPSAEQPKEDPKLKV